LAQRPSHDEHRSGQHSPDDHHDGHDTADDHEHSDDNDDDYADDDDDDDGNHHDHPHATARPPLDPVGRRPRQAVRLSAAVEHVCSHLV
jgi:hypothetical protein